MSVTQLLNQLAEIGVKLSIEGGRLKVRSPKGALTRTLRDQLASHRDEVLRLLSQETGSQTLAQLPRITPDLENRYQPFPLTDIQQAYWIGSQSDFELGGLGIHIYTEIDCPDLDLDRFTRAWQGAIERHDMLRAVVEPDGTQRIVKDVPAYVPKLLDLRHSGSADANQTLTEIRDQLSHSHRTPDQWPGFEVRATLIDDRHTRLHVSIDLLHIDGGSLQGLFGDLVALYRDPRAVLPALDLSYRDYVLAEASLHQSDFYQQSLEYWRQQLDDLPAAPQLPTARGNTTRPRFKHGTAAVDREVWDAVKSYARELGFSLPAVLLTIYAEALGNWSRSKDLTINVTLFNRLPMHPQVDQILGDFTSMVLLGIRHDKGDSFEARVHRVQDKLWSAFEHRHVSGVQVLRELAAARGSRSGALMPVVFTSFLNLDDDGHSSPSHTLGALGNIVFSITQTPQVWLDHQVMEDDGQLLLSWDALEDAFPPHLIDDLFAGYQRLLVRLQDRAAWQKPCPALIAPAELDTRRRINATDRRIPDGTLYDLFADQADQRGDHTALVAGNRSFSYGQLRARACRLGRWLRDRGARPDSLVAVVMEKGWEQIVAVLGIMASGAAYLPIDPDQPAERLQYLLDDGEITVVLTQARLVRSLPASPGRTVLAVDAEGDGDGLDSDRLEPAQSPDHLAYVLYTSGSTGIPKGVMIEHRSVVNRMTDIATRFDIGPGDKVLGVTALHHDLSVFDIFGILTCGATLVLPDAKRRLDPDHWAELMIRDRVTLWNSVPTFLQMLVEYLEGTAGARRIDSLRWAILAGDWIALDLPARLRAVAGEVMFIASGGPTETTVWDIWNPVIGIDPAWTSIPYGKPLANARYYILNDDDQPCPTWVPGEMCIAGVGLARGYWKRPHEPFFTHPDTGERLYRSGDLGRYLPNGNIEILGRKDHQVKIRGVRIELGEIEATVARHPDVRATVVMAIGERFEPGRLVAFYVANQAASESSDTSEGIEGAGQGSIEDRLRAFLASKLPLYMVPDRYVAVDSLPLGPTGKVDRLALSRLAGESAQSTGPTDGFIAPRTTTEEQVAELWCRALGIDQLSVQADLLHLGMSSLTAIQVHGQLQEQFEVELPLRLLLDSPTVAGLARSIDELKRDGGDTTAALPTVEPDPAGRFEPFALNPIQQAYWMGRMGTFELGNVAAHYYLEFDIPPADIDQLNRAWRGVIARHDMLRAIVRSDGQQQILSDVEPYTIEYQDMRAWDPARAESRRMELRERMAHQVRPSQQWPLFEFRVTQVSDQALRCHFYLDLLIADAWSAQILFDDFRRLMEQPDANATPPALTFRDYLIADSKLDDSLHMARSRQYWQQRMDELAPAPSLPLARDPSSIAEPRFVRRSFRLSVDRWDRLKERASAASVTASGLLLTAFGEVLARFSRSPRLTINVTTFRRLPLHPQVHSIVGDFTSLTLLTIDCSNPQTFENRARTVQDRLWQDLEHRYISGIDVLRQLAKKQRRAPGALMPVVFTSLLTRYEDSRDKNSDGSQADRASPTVDEIFALSQTPQVWLDHQVVEQGGALVINWDAVDELFPDRLLDDMMADYRALLRSLADGDEAWRAPIVRGLADRQGEQRARVNATFVELEDATLHGLFEATAASRGESLAVIAADREMTYAQLDEYANRVARWLDGQNRPGQARGAEQALVAVVMAKGWQQVVAVLGVLKSGAAYVPIDPDWPDDRRNYVMEQCGVLAILTQESLLFSLDWPEQLARLAVDSDQPGDSPLPSIHRPEALAYVIFTSGSTGRPKGVSITHRGAVNTVLDINRRFGIGSTDRVFAISSLSFDLSVYDVFGTLAAGGTVVIPEPWAVREPGYWLDAMNRHRVSVWNSVPALMEMLCEYSASQTVSWPARLRLVMLSGDWLPVNIATRIRHHVPECRVISLGGATEASVWSVFHDIERVDPAWRSVPYGKPLANQRLHVLDTHRAPRPVWVPGELYISGTGVARDYFGEPDKTAASFVIYRGPVLPGGPAPGERLYRTGDWARYLPDGTIEFLGRHDLQVKIHGYRIELGEIESVLTDHPEVASAVAVVSEGQNGRRLVAFCVPTAGTEISAESLREHAASRLASYMVPSAFVIVDSLPLTANGKVDRAALAALSSPGGQRAESVKPRTPVEQQLAELWRELLDITDDQPLGVHDTLFDLGGNSLVAIRMLARLHEMFRVEVSMRSLFENPTVAALADVVVGLKATAGETGQSLGGGLGLTIAQSASTANHSDRFEPFPLSDVQQAYLLGRIANLELGNVAAHAYFEIDVPSADAQRIKRAWQALIDRHDALRTVFRENGTQRVLAQVPDYDMPIIDLRNSGDGEAHAELMAIRETLSHQVLPADTWPLFDIRICVLGADRMRICISFDLLIADAWSSQILFLELATLARDPDAILPPLELSFRDYMVAMRDLPRTAAYQRAEAYWTMRVPEMPGAPELPIIKDPASIDAPRFQRRADQLEPDVWASLQERASRAGLTPSGLCLAAFTEVLATWSAEPSFTVNVTTFNRLPVHPQIGNVVGDFTSLTLLAVNGAGRGRFESRARRVQEQLWEDLDHRHYSGVQVVRDLAAQLGRAPGALMPVVFTSRLFAAGNAELSGASAPIHRNKAIDLPGGEVVYSVSQTPQVWLDMQVSEHAGALTWTWDAVEELFPEALLDDMFAAYGGLMRRLAGDDETWGQEIVSLAPALHRDSVARVNATSADPSQATLYELFADMVEQNPDHPAVISEAETLTYRELDSLARAVASWVRGHGVGVDERVAIVMEKGWQQVAAAVGIAASGAAYVPIDPDWPESRLRLLLADAGARCVITHPQLAESLAWPDTIPRLVLTRQTAVELAGAGDESSGLAEPIKPPRPEHLAYVIFTSGTTGRPKGVAMEHGAVVNTLLDMRQRFALTASDRVFGISALTFDLSVFDIFGTLAAGATLVLPDPGDRRDPGHWAVLLNKYRVSVWNSVPALMDMLLEHAGQAQGAVPDSLRLVLLSGDWLPLDIAERLHRHVATARVVSLGGATEAAIWSIWYPVDGSLPGWASVPYGRPLTNQCVHVLDTHYCECPLWVPGDLYIGGIGLARHYLGDAKKTAASFITHPRTGERLYRTGDRGRWRPGGVIEFLGRQDTQVKVQGHRIELGEIEAVLSASPDVVGVVVVAPGETRGNRHLVAYIVPCEANETGSSETDSNEVISKKTADEDSVIAGLRELAASELPSYMVPGAFVVLDRFPLTGNGKVDRGALTGRPVHHGGSDDGDQARTPVERELAGIWAELLGLERVGIRDNLFELGGNSLLAIRMVGEIKRRMGVELELRTLFANASIASLAQAVAQERLHSQDGGAAPEELRIAVDRANRYQPFPLNDVQQAYWLGREQALELGSVAAHSYTELDSTVLEPDRIQMIWRRLIKRHDMLRAVFQENGLQRVIPCDELPLFEIPVRDLSSASEDERQRELAAIRAEMSHQVLPTNRWPLFDIRISRLSPERIRIHYSFDLLISDAWSSQLLILEFAYLYAEPDAAMEPLEVTFRDYMLAVARKEHSSRYRRDRNYWRHRLDELAPAPELPLARDPATLGQPRFVRRHGQLEPAVWQALCERAASAGITPSGLLLAVFAETLAAWSRNPRFTVNVTTFNRMPLHEQIDAVVGDFTSLTLLAVDTSPGPDGNDEIFALRARRLQEQLWADLDHRRYSGVEVIRDLARARGQSPGALMPVVFTSRLFRDPRVAKFTDSDVPYGDVVYSVSQTPQVWLDAQVLEQGGRLLWSWDTVDELFPDHMIDDLFAAHTGLLQHLANDPGAWHRAAFDLVPESHRALYARANDTACDLGELAIATMDRLVAASFARWPERPAVITNQRTVSYRELWRAASHLAHRLRDRGVSPNRLVAVVMEKGWQQAVATLAVMLAGGAYLPVNPSWPGNRRQIVMELGEVVCALTQAGLDLSWPDGPNAIDVVRIGDDVLAAEAVDPPMQTATTTDLAYVIFTSGSTGTPKGAAIEHRSAINTIVDLNRRLGVTAGDRVLALSDLSFDLSVYDFYGMFAAGGAAVLPDPDAHRDPSAWSNTAARHGVTLWNSVPALLDMMLTHADSHPGAIPASLRLAMLSGDWLPVDIGDRLVAHRPDARTVSLGGATEAAIWSIAYPVPTPAPSWPSVPYGKPLANQSFHVLDCHLQQRPLHVAGELYIGGVGLARGYFADDAKTSASFIIHPESGERLYRTGDMGKYLPDGNIEFLGRQDTQVKVGGYRIELGEIEAALARSEHVVAAVASAPYIGGGAGRARRLVAHVVVRAELRPLDVAGLRRSLAEQIPDYMIPATFIELDSLPLTPNGKVDRRALPDPSPHIDSDARVPRTTTEQRLIRLWSRLLGIDTVGIDDNLFELGGSSLVAVQLVNAIRDEFGVELSLRTLFENLTVRQLALSMSRDRASGQAVMVSKLPVLRPDLAHRHDPFPLNDIQQAYWVGRMGVFDMGDFSAHYYTEVDSVDLDLDGFTFALRAMIERHDALRLVFLPDGQQRILPEVPAYQVEVLDLRDASPADRERQLLELRHALSHRVRATDTWPLFEVRATRIDRTRTRLHLSFDLLLADAWSFQLLFMEMARLARSPQTAVEPLDISFRDYVLAEKKLEETELYRRSQAYWNERISGLPPAPQLPLRASRPDNARFERLAGRLPAEQWNSIKKTAAAFGVTPTGVLMTAFAEVLGAWSKSPRFTLNVTMFNRLPIHPQVHSILGEFTSMTLVGVDTGPMDGPLGDDSFALRARRLQERLWTDLDHGHYGGVRVLRDLGRRQGGSAVLMPVVFTSRLFTIQGFGGDTAAGESVGELVYSISQTPQVWLDHHLTEEDGALCFNWDVVVELFPEGMIEAMFAAYWGLVEALARDAETWHRPVPALIPDQQRQTLIALEAAEDKKLPSLPALHEFVAGQARMHPDRTALIVDARGGEFELTYGELMERACAVADWLVERGACADMPVALVLHAGWEQAVAALGVMTAGAPFLPINPDHQAELLADLLERGEVRLILTRSDLLQAFSRPQAAGHWLAVDHVVRGSGQLQGQRSIDDLPDHDIENLAYMIFDVASDGEPRGVAVPHSAAVNAMVHVNRQFDITKTDKVFAPADLNQDRGVYNLFAPLVAGATVVLPRPGAVRDSDYLWATSQRQNITVWSSDPVIMDTFVLGTSERTESVWAPRVILLSGEPVPTALAERLHQRWPSARVASLSGSAETATWSLVYELGRADSPTEASSSESSGSGDNGGAGVMPLGRPLPGQTAFILDKQHRPRPIGVPGDLYIGGAGLARGYWADEDSTELAFAAVLHPLHAGETVRLFRTGDVCQMRDNGVIELVGRDDTPVAIRRQHREFSEIEAVLGQHDSVGAAAVAAFPVRSPEPGAPTRRLVAYVVSRQSMAATSALPASPPLVEAGPVNANAGGASMPAFPAADDRWLRLEFEPISVPVERLQFKLERRFLRRDLNGEVVHLDGALEDDSQAFINRRSRRRFLPRAVSADDFAALLEVLRYIEPKGSPLPKYRYPSGGGLYPVQAYISIEPGRVDGFSPGIYYYHPGAHRLDKLSEAPAPPRFHAPQNRPIVDAAAFTIFFIGRLSAVAALYPGLGRDFCVLEAGYMGQLLMEETPASVGLCPLGGMAFEAIRDRFDLEETDELVHLITGGAVSNTAESLKEAFLAEQLDARDLGAMDQPTALVAPPGSAPEPVDWMSRAIFDPIARLQFKLDKRGLRAESGAAVALPLQLPGRLAAHTGDNPDHAIEAVYARRRSYSHFMLEPVGLVELGRWLACLRSVQPAGMPLPKYRYPSGGGLYPVQTYLHVRPDRVDGLRAGTYYYDAESHRLVAITTDVDIPVDCHGPPNRPIYQTAAFSIFLIGKLSAVAPLYPDMARDFCLLEAGYMGQLLMTTNMEHGIGVTPIGGLAFEELRHLFALDEDHDLAHTFIGGRVSTTPAALFDDGDRPVSHGQLDPDEVRGYLRERLPPYQVPGHVMVLDRLPLTPEGALDRAALTDPQGSADIGAGRHSFEDPANQNEQRVADIWRDVLATTEVGVTHNFFELGGTSVQMVRLHNRLQERFERRFPLVDLFENPTIRDQARYFAASKSAVDMGESREQASRRKAARRRRRRR
ncbi:MAG: amino acid adenylation domain-containing protein [Proteobacteria bacterium]|nr:amino acid adenylation domain-containing protein [Pseudomonadota bacterium]